MDKKHLAIALSKLAPLEIKQIHLEQYQTDSELASLLLWQALPASQCPAPKPVLVEQWEDEFESADMIFVGEFQNSHYNSRDGRVTFINGMLVGTGSVDALFRVVQVYKWNELRLGQMVRVRTFSESPRCCFKQWSQETKGKQWVVYGRIIKTPSKPDPSDYIFDNTVPDTKIIVNLGCASPDLLAEIVEAKLQFLTAKIKEE